MIESSVQIPPGQNTFLFDDLSVAHLSKYSARKVEKGDGIRKRVNRYLKPAKKREHKKHNKSLMNRASKSRDSDLTSLTRIDKSRRLPSQDLKLDPEQSESRAMILRACGFDM